MKNPVWEIIRRLDGWTSLRSGIQKLATRAAAPCRVQGGLLSVALVALAVIGAGCGMTMSRTQTAREKEETKNIAANQNQIRLRMRALVHPMCGEIEQTADNIIAGTTDRAVQQGALLWRIDAVPALREALFQPAPLTAVMDTWVLFFQMIAYFESGPGRKLLGEASGQALATCQSMEEKFSRIAASATKSGDASKLRAAARKWAAEHPIRYSISGRESALSRALEQDVAETFSLGDAVTEVTITLDDLNRKMSIYSDQLFRQARWEAELIRLNLIDKLSAEQAIPLAERAVKSAEQATATAERVAPDVERAAGTIQDMPKLVATERDATIRAFQGEIRNVVEIVHAERLAAMMQLHEALATERAAALRDLDQMGVRTMDQATARFERLAAIAVAVVMLAVLLGLILVRWIFFRRPLELRHSAKS